MEPPKIVVAPPIAKSRTKPSRTRKRKGPRTTILVIAAVVLSAITLTSASFYFRIGSNDDVPKHLKNQVVEYIMANSIGIDTIEFVSWRMRKFQLKPQSEMSLDDFTRHFEFQAFQTKAEWIGMDCVEVETEIGPKGLRRRNRFVFVTDGKGLIGGPFSSDLFASETKRSVDSYPGLGAKSQITPPDVAENIADTFNLGDGENVEFNFGDKK